MTMSASASAGRRRIDRPFRTYSDRGTTARTTTARAARAVVGAIRQRPGGLCFLPPLLPGLGGVAPPGPLLISITIAVFFVAMLLGFVSATVPAGQFDVTWPPT